MSNIKHQMDIAAEAMEKLIKAVDHAPYNYEVEEALFEAVVELRQLGLDIQR